MDLHKIAEDIIMLVERHIEEEALIDLKILSEKMNISKFYLSRIFSAVMGISINKYILSRRLNASLSLVGNRTQPIVNVAYRLNFGSQASFTRAFKATYGVPPSAIKQSDISMHYSEAPSVVKRQFKNLNGDVITDFSLIQGEDLFLFGIVFSVILELEDYRAKIKGYINDFFEAANVESNNQCYLVYSNCHPHSPEFNVLFGVCQEVLNEEQKALLTKTFENTVSAHIPSAFYADFKYQNDLLDISMVFETDFARILKLTHLERGKTGIELMQVFKTIDDLMDHYRVLIPVKKSTLS